MTGRILLIEPYREVADLITACLEDMGYSVDLITDAVLPGALPNRGDYACAFINLDQNKVGWREQGLSLATILSERGLPIVMIPDHQSDVGALEQHDWFYIRKPFSVDRLQAVVKKAIVLASAKPVIQKTKFS